MTSIDDMASEIMKGLQEYADLADTEVKKAVRKTATEVRKEISSNALLIKGKVAAHSRVNIPLLTFMLHGSQKIELEETYPAKQPDEARRYRKKKGENT